MSHDSCTPSFFFHHYRCGVSSIFDGLGYRLLDDQFITHHSGYASTTINKHSLTLLYNYIHLAHRFPSEPRTPACLSATVCHLASIIGSMHVLLKREAPWTLGQHHRPRKKAFLLSLTLPNFPTFAFSLNLLNFYFYLYFYFPPSFLPTLSHSSVILITCSGFSGAIRCHILADMLTIVPFQRSSSLFPES